MDISLKDAKKWTYKSLSATFVVAALAASVSVLYERYSNAGLDQLENALRKTPEGIKYATSQDRCIHAGRGIVTDYDVSSNKASDALASKALPGYGLCRPTHGSRQNLTAVQADGNETSLALAQGDIFFSMKENGQLPKATLITKTDLTECLFPASEKHEDLLALEIALKEAQDKGTKLIIGLPNAASGSYFTGQRFIQSYLDPAHVEIREFYDNQRLLDAVKRKEVDLGLFVQGPGNADGKIRYGAKKVADEGINLVGLWRQKEDLLQQGYKWFSMTIGGQSVHTFCTQAVWVGRDPDTIEAGSERDNAAFLRDTMRILPLESISLSAPTNIKPVPPTR